MQFDESISREAFAWLKGSDTQQQEQGYEAADPATEPGAVTYCCAAARLSRHTETEDMPNNVFQLKALIKEMQFTISLLNAIIKRQHQAIAALKEELLRQEALRQNSPFDFED